ncbi:hypothetical protein [Methylopila sp. M107]|uniref:dioxygenase family protein n=1 Tax=Methylopila sp. M107 TaxID=1101190 RepID=UPI00036B5CB4|nr:hypothetical protein [Methylopila sp. M107]
MSEQRTPPRLSRRAALAAFAAPAVASTAGTSRAEDAASARIVEPGHGVCVLAPQAVEGPFYYDPKLVRSDIREGRPGVPLELRLALIERQGCAPIADARVDVWHCDASGEYSGFSGPGGAGGASDTRSTFMRGTQMSGADGAVAFRTVYPGWYQGRTPHIHLKAFLDGRNVLTTQLYFPDALSEYIYQNVAAYRRGSAKRDTVNATDGVLAHTENGRSTFVALTEETDRYLATLTIAVDRKAAVDEGRGAPPLGPGGNRRGPPPTSTPGIMLERLLPSGPLVPGSAR